MSRICKTFIIICFLILLIPGILIVLPPDNKFSENENRVLEKRPKIRISKIFDGKYQEQLESFYSDQFVFRDFWTGTATKVKKLMGYKDVGGVYIGKDHYYFEKITADTFPMRTYRKNVYYLNRFLKGQKALNCTVMMVPSPGHVLSDKLPTGATMYYGNVMASKASQTLREYKFIYPKKALQAEEKKQVFYKTDHHWTGYGAYLAYVEYCKANDITPQDYQAFNPKTVSTEFYGTLYSKALDSAAKPDSIEIPKELPDVTITIDKEEKDSIYDEDKLKEKDKYAVFFGGNYGMMTINTEAANGKKLLLVKDSFANSLVPYLLNEYETIYMLDLRYFRDNVSELISENQVTDILILYEMSNFAQDSNIFRLALKARKSQDTASDNTQGTESQTGGTGTQSTGSQTGGTGTTDVQNTETQTTETRTGGTGTTDVQNTETQTMDTQTDGTETDGTLNNTDTQNNETGNDNSVQ